MRHGEAFYWLGVQGVVVLILLGALFPPRVTPASQQGFDSQSLHCLLLYPSLHLGSLILSSLSSLLTCKLLAHKVPEQSCQGYLAINPVNTFQTFPFLIHPLRLI
jgi:hypothetical protein